MPIYLPRLPSVEPEPSNSAIARSGLGSKEEESKDPTRPAAGSRQRGCLDGILEDPIRATIGAECSRHKFLVITACSAIGLLRSWGRATCVMSHEDDKKDWEEGVPKYARPRS